jgi:hypothetical protein
MTNHDANKRQREFRKRTGNAITKRYEKTKNGFLMRLYRNMKSRVSGVQSLKHHLYKGKSILDKKEFYEWSKSRPEFHELFCNWERSGYQRKLTPSVDRVNPLLGYEISNMEWVTMSVNSARSKISKNKIKEIRES